MWPVRWFVYRRRAGDLCIFFLLPQYRSSRKPGRRQRSGRSLILNKKEFILTINISVKWQERSIDKNSWQKKTYPFIYLTNTTKQLGSSRNCTVEMRSNGFHNFSDLLRQFEWNQRKERNCLRACSRWIRQPDDQVGGPVGVTWLGTWIRLAWRCWGSARASEVIVCHVGPIEDTMLRSTWINWIRRWVCVFLPQ